MKNLSWATYGLGVVVVVFVLMSGELSIFLKSLIVAGTLFVGALIAAIHELARTLAASKGIAHAEAPSRDRAEA